MASGMMFCPDCDNLLQPKEDLERRELKFLCRRCDFFKYSSGSPTENCVDRINVGNKTKQDFRVVADLARDPTLGRVKDWNCKRCKRSVEAVYFELPERVAEDAMTLVFVCAACGYWKKQERTEGETDADDTADEFGAGLVKRDLFKSAPDEEEELDAHSLRRMPVQKTEPALDSPGVGDDLIEDTDRRAEAELFGDGLPDAECDEAWEEIGAQGDDLIDANAEEGNEDAIFGNESPDDDPN